MKKVLILGVTGMLGSAVYDVLKDKYNLVLSVRDKSKIKLLEEAYGGTDNCPVVKFDATDLYNDFLEKQGNPSPYLNKFINKVGDVDYVINTIGITIPYALENEASTFFINGALPHILAGGFGEKLIHITTDCVYNGKEGYPYNENSQETPVDIYGLSKSLGEPKDCLTIRTSIIGKELEGFTGFLEWFLKQEGKELNGFTEHYWNGITTKQFGEVCNQIISKPNKYPQKGVYHIFSDTVSKYKMLKILKEKFNINCTINEDHEHKLNRSLSTVRELNEKLDIPSFKKMVEKL